MNPRASKRKPNIIKYKDGTRIPYKHGTRLSLRLDKLDERTKVGKTAKLLTEFLWDYVGDVPIAAMLIDTIVFKKIKMILFEDKAMESGLDGMPAMYLTLSNSLRQDLALLAQFVEQPQAPDLDNYLENAYGKPGK